jgi:hypothetical protein
MTMIQVNVPDELAQRLMKYRARWVEVLEAGLRAIEPAQPGAERETEMMQAVLQKLAREGKLILPHPTLQPYQRHALLELSGKPLSEIVIEQRGEL